MAIQVRLMGPVMLLRDGKPVEVGGPKQCTILGLLALSAGRRVSTERIVDVVWADDPPASARRTVQSYIAALRRLLGADAPLVSSHGGYVLEISPGAVDLLEFEDAVVAALADVKADPAAAATALAEALDDWDVPMDGLRGGSRVDELAVPFDELQLQGVEGLATAQIASSRAVDAVRMLEALVRQHPTREHMWLLLARGLAASGRRDDALTAVHRAREALREHLGVHLSPALSNFETELLDGSPNSTGDEVVEVVLGRPSGTVTFLFTDVVGSTRRWEADPDVMRAELAAHDDVLRRAIETRGGWLFKHTGDGVCAAFASARAAVDAAVEAQRLLALPVRIGVSTGEAVPSGDDYFGPALNRAARVMAVGHGGQILVSGSTAGLVPGVDLVDLGEHRLRDLPEVEHVFQVRAEGLASEFAPLRTVNASPGNLLAQATSFVGRDVEVKSFPELVRRHRLVTLTGVGGVGKTRLALQVAAALRPEFGDGVWFVELAPVGDPASVPNAVATALGVRTLAGRSVTESVAETLAGRRMLMVLDNCEHVLKAAADLVEAILGSSTTVSIVVTSREGLGVAGEQLSVVEPFDLSEGASSAAVKLFAERAGAVVAGFSLDGDADEQAATEICRRLDGLALGIELAAAQMVSMTPAEVLARLNERFRLLSGSQRRPERHQTLRQVVQWSYDLLTTEEQAVLRACAVFAGGFDASAATEVCNQFDEYTMLEELDSLVRKSLVTASRVGSRTRFAMLETIRQFGVDQHADGIAGPTDEIGEVRSRHARYFAAQAVTHWDVWDGPHQREATEWIEVEFDNLRAGFRWAIERHDVTTATAIAAHTMAIAFNVQRFEPVDWAEEVLPAAALADVAQLPRLYVAASFCQFLGRGDEAVEYAHAATTLQGQPRYEPFDIAWVSHREALAHLFAGRSDRYVEICTGLASQAGVAHVIGLCGLTYGLPLVGRTSEAIAIAEDTIAVARSHGNPFWVAFAYLAYGRAFAVAHPVAALDTLNEGLAYTREHRLRHHEALIAREAAEIAAAHGDLDRALILFAFAVDSFHGAGDEANLASTFAGLVVLFDDLEQPEVAATMYGTIIDHPYATRLTGVTAAARHLRHVLEPDAFAAAADHLGCVLDSNTFDDCVRTGATMSLAEAVHYAQRHIETTRRHER